MRCLWKLIPWPKRRKLPDEEDHSLIPGRATILQPWGTPRNAYHNSQSSLQERYVRVGIGGAGNLRKWCSFFPEIDVLLDDDVSDLMTELGLYHIMDEPFRQLHVDPWDTMSKGSGEELRMALGRTCRFFGKNGHEWGIIVKLLITGSRSFWQRL